MMLNTLHGEKEGIFTASLGDSSSPPAENLLAFPLFPHLAVTSPLQGVLCPEM